MATWKCPRCGIETDKEQWQALSQEDPHGFDYTGHVCPSCVLITEIEGVKISRDGKYDDATIRPDNPSWIIRSDDGDFRNVSRRSKRKMKSKDEYRDGIFEASTDDLVHRLAVMLDEIIYDAKFEMTKDQSWHDPGNAMKQSIRMHESIISSIKFIAVYFSPVYLDQPLPFPGWNLPSITTIDAIVSKIHDIVECLEEAQSIANAMSMADFAEMHDHVNPPSDRAMRRNRELFNRLQTITSSFYMIENVAKHWLKQQHDVE